MCDAFRETRVNFVAVLVGALVVTLPSVAADPPKNIKVKSSDGTLINAALYVLDALTSGRMPAVITIQAGKGGMDPDRLPAGIGPNANAATYRMLASGRYNVLSIGYYCGIRNPSARMFRIAATVTF
jgi:hypothetical protein